MQNLLHIPGYTLYTKVEIEKRGRAIVTRDVMHFTIIENGRTQTTDKSVVDKPSYPRHGFTLQDCDI